MKEHRRGTEPAWTGKQGSELQLNGIEGKRAARENAKKPQRKDVRGN